MTTANSIDSGARQAIYIFLIRLISTRDNYRTILPYCILFGATSDQAGGPATRAAASHLIGAK